MCDTEGMSETWISTAEASEIWGLSPGSVRRAVRLGEVGYRRKGTRGRLSVKADDVHELMVVKSRSDDADAAGVAAGTDDYEPLDVA